MRGRIKITTIIQGITPRANNHNSLLGVVFEWPMGFSDKSLPASRFRPSANHKYGWTSCFVEQSHGVLLDISTTWHTVWSHWLGWERCTCKGNASRASGNAYGTSCRSSYTKLNKTQNGSLRGASPRTGGQGTSRGPWQLSLNYWQIIIARPPVAWYPH